MKYGIYAHVLSIFTIGFSLFAMAFWRLSQNTLTELMEVDPTAVVPATDFRFGFTLATFVIVALLTFAYNIAPYYIGDRTISKKHIITGTIVTIVGNIAGFAMLNLSWQFAFIGVVVIIFEVITIPKELAIQLYTIKKQ